MPVTHGGAQADGSTPGGNVQRFVRKSSTRGMRRGGRK